MYVCTRIYIKTYSKGTKLVVWWDIYLDLLGLFGKNYLNICMYQYVHKGEFTFKLLFTTLLF